MSGKTVAGLVLVVIGILVFAYGGLTYTTHKKVLDVGPLQATKEEHHTIFLPPIIGAIVLIGGIAVIASDRRSS